MKGAILFVLTNIAVAFVLRVAFYVICAFLGVIAALRRLGNLQPGVLPDSLKAFGVVGSRRVSLFSTHPALEDRIAALSKLPQ